MSQPPAATLPPEATRTSARPCRWGDGLWLLACFALSSAWCVTAARELGATYDEPFYFAAGLEHWRTGSAARLLYEGTMPLPADLCTLLVYCWERWRGVPFDPVGELPALLPLARTGTLVCWALLLLYAWRCGRQLAGAWGGRLAVALLAFEPVFLAHASLATTDVALSAALLAFCYHFRTGRGASWGQRIGLPAVWFGTAVLCKASGLVLAPLCMLAIEGERWWSAGRRPARRELRGAASEMAAIAALGMGAVFLYCGTDWRAEPHFVAWARTLPRGFLQAAAPPLAEGLRVFPNAGVGLALQVVHNVESHGGVFLLGRSMPGSVWYYFPVALAIKLTLGLLLLPVLVAAVRARALRNWACLAAALILLDSLTFRVQIGVRFLLPLVALLAVGLGAALAQALAEPLPHWRRRALAAGAAAAVLGALISTARVWPHGLCYTNPGWGGTEWGYRLLSDSNYDWGQGLPELAAWHRRQGSPPLAVWYFGKDPLLARLPVQPKLLNLVRTGSREELASVVGQSYLAASTTYLYGALGTPAAERLVAYLRRQRPVARTTTFLIYDFRRGPREHEWVLVKRGSSRQEAARRGHNQPGESPDD